ncbi:IS1096 element passenger TnpR family protein [Pseudopedobacter beijingensis]|uniref:Plasmid pRiA4b Orf3-like domain-containing protein n=1 Tax=Pseudopedobacter beijingensis TaxID=1207056 RepID=A0ABW4IGA5_9SPHI
MAIYRFRISFEDYDDVIREIDIKSNQTFKDLHLALHKSIGYDPEKSSSFYVSNDQWIKNEEIAYMPNPRKIDRGVILMENSKLSSFIDDPHQKFYYVYNFDKPFDFHVQLIRILENDTKEYPLVFKSVGEAPKIFTNSLISPMDDPGEDDEDFIDEEDVLIADEEELGSLNGREEDDEQEEEEDEFSNEFSDDDNYDSGDYDED